MKIIVGLGNPGKEYENTRHNAGFMFLDVLTGCAKIAPVDKNIEFREEKKYKALIAETTVKGEKLVFVKPQTFMNASGFAVSKITQFYKTSPDELIVVSDDIDMPVGRVRIRLQGSSGGHKGIQSIIDQLKYDNFIRIRIGVNSLDEIKRREDETNNFVLSKPSKREEEIINQAIGNAVNFLLQFVGTKNPIPAHSLEMEFDSLK